tara:strand:+ start:86 stop:250 length:165 start_codon:yes stop_codon:yes gene_type:complete
MLKFIRNLFKKKYKPRVEVTEALGHNHEWEEHWNPKKVVCWICNKEVFKKDLNK